MLPILALLVGARERGIPLSQLTRGLPARYTASDRLQGFPGERSRQLVERLAESREALDSMFGSLCGDAVAMDQTDGLRITFARGEIVHLRPSGNAPELRCYAEADSPERAAALADACLQRVKASAI